jgi:F0F1-type ATP synthase assembly protein I
MADWRDSSGDERLPEPQGAGSDGQAWSIVSYLLSGLVVWGGVGWLLDRWLGTSFLVLIGLLVGASASLYLVWLRYGRP